MRFLCYKYELRRQTTERENMANICKINLSLRSLSFRNENPNILRSFRALIYLLEYVCISYVIIFYLEIYQYVADLFNNIFIFLQKFTS